MTVDLMLNGENRGYHDENWNASRASEVRLGNNLGSVMAEGIFAKLCRSWYAMRDVEEQGWSRMACVFMTLTALGQILCARASVDRYLGLHFVALNACLRFRQTGFSLLTTLAARYGTFSKMPLDGHAHLVSQGWAGKGSGLRQGAINRPVVVAQKKTLSGIGKDRDEAFPFWDQLVFRKTSIAVL